MNEKQLISAIKQLKQIKPRKEWAILVKRQLLNSDKVWNILDFLPSLVFQRKLAYALATLVFIIVGVFGFAQYTVPGDLLFSVKRITEQSQTVFMPDQLKYNFEIANKRLQDLTQVVKENRTQNIAAAVSEFKATLSGAAKNLAQNISGSDRNSLKEIAAEVKKLEASKKQLETLGIDLSSSQGTNELENALASLVGAEITDLEKTTLTEDQQKELGEIKKLYDEEKFFEALEGILMINN